MRFGGTPWRTEGDSLPGLSLQESRVMWHVCAVFRVCLWVSDTTKMNKTMPVCTVGNTHQSWMNYLHLAAGWQPYLLWERVNLSSFIAPCKVMLCCQALSRSDNLIVSYTEHQSFCQNMLNDMEIICHNNFKLFTLNTSLPCRTCTVFWVTQTFWCAVLWSVENVVSILSSKTKERSHECIYTR